MMEKLNEINVPYFYDLYSAFYNITFPSERNHQSSRDMLYDERSLVICIYMVCCFRFPQISHTDKHSARESELDA